MGMVVLQIMVGGVMKCVMDLLVLIAEEIDLWVHDSLTPVPWMNLNAEWQ